MKTWFRSGWEKTALSSKCLTHSTRTNGCGLLCIHSTQVLRETFKLLCASFQDPYGLVFRGDIRPIRCLGCTTDRSFGSLVVAYIFFYPLLQGTRRLSQIRWKQVLYL